MGQNSAFAWVEPRAQLHPHQQTFATTIKSSHSGRWPSASDRFRFFDKKIADGRIAIAHEGPRDVALKGSLGSLKATVWRKWPRAGATIRHAPERIVNQP